MGADVFVQTEKGKTAKEAFKRAQDEAFYEVGHGGYSGTIAEKRSFVMFRPNPGQTVKKFIDVIEEASSFEPDSAEHKKLSPNERSAALTFDDKWGPAVCVEIPESEMKDWFTKITLKKDEHVYVFCGWASS